MNYEAFTTGDISAQSLANIIVEKLVQAIPGFEAAGLAKSLAVKINALIGATDGFQWTDLGSVIVDLANFILEFTPYATFGDIVSLLWSVSNLL